MKPTKEQLFNEVKILRKQNAKLSGENTILKKQKNVLNEKVALLEETVKSQKQLIDNQALVIENLKLQLEELKKIVFKPKGKNKRKLIKTKTDNSTKKRKKDSYQRSVPTDEDVTEEIKHSINCCPNCKEKLTDKKETVFYLEDIDLMIDKLKKKKLKIVEKHIVEKGYCKKCRKWRSAVRIPPAKVIIGNNVKMYIAYLTILLRNSYTQVIKLFKDTYDFKLSEGEVSNILTAEAQSLKPEFERLKRKIRNQKGIHMDETPWKVHKGDLGNYAWIMTGTDTEDVVFDIGKSRGKGVAKKLQGDKKLIGISDDYNAYSKLFSIHQLCWAHPHRKLRDLSVSEKLNDDKREYCEVVFKKFKEIYMDLEETLKSEFDLEKRRIKQGEIKGKLTKLSQLHKKDPAKLVNIKKGLLRNVDKYVVCLVKEGIPADNNKAERGLRHLVLKRKISFGCNTQKGADRLSVLMSVLLSLWNKNPDNFFLEYLTLKS